MFFYRNVSFDSIAHLRFNTFTVDPKRYFHITDAQNRFRVKPKKFNAMHKLWQSEGMSYVFLLLLSVLNAVRVFVD